MKTDGRQRSLGRGCLDLALWAFRVVTYGGHTIPIRAIYTVINPMVGFVESFRAVLYDRHWPPLSMVGYATVWSLAMLWVGIVVFRRFEPRLAEEL